MCLSPIKIRNPNLNAFSRKNELTRLFSDCESQFILVPCNRCSVCIALRQNYFVQRVQMECLDRVLFFVTLTYNNEYVPKLIIDGEELLVHDIRDLQNMWKRIRKNYDLPNFRYFVTCEYGSRTHRPHYHLLLTFPYSYFNLSQGKPIFNEVLSFERKLQDILLNEWVVNIGSNRNPDYQPLCNFHCNGDFRTFDCQFVDTIYQDCKNVSFYVSKYVCKYDKYVDAILKQFRYLYDDFEYYYFKERFKPKFLYSKGFGNVESPLVKKYIRDCIDLSLRANSPFPCFYDSVNGTSFPMSPYFRRKFLTFDEEIKFLSNSRQDSLSNFSRVLENDSDILESVKKSVKFFQNVDYLSYQPDIHSLI